MSIHITLFILKKCSIPPPYYNAIKLRKNYFQKIHLSLVFSPLIRGKRNNEPFSPDKERRFR
jgi:hypothetical protein